MQQPVEDPVKHHGVPEAPPRRSFFNWIWGALGLAVLAEMIWLAGAFLRPRRRRIREGDFGTVIAAGPVDNFARNTVTAFPRGRFYLARLEDGGFLALSRECTHLGCTVPWDEKERAFRCPCHASVFDIRGNAVHAPATRALDLFKVAIENNTITVDTGRRMRRSAFRGDQAVYPTQT
jgi:cytochrome b6-f complex iron-sulfur subunit